MYTNPALITYSTLTSAHLGTGSDNGLINLPIQREKHTSLPQIASTSQKGCLKENAGMKNITHLWGINYETILKLVFGSDRGAEQAGAMMLTDAKCLFFPIKSAKGVFAWATCPLVLQRLKRDINLLGYDLLVPKALTVSKLSHLVNEDLEILLEDNVYKVSKSEEVDTFVDFILDFLPSNAVLKDMLKTNIVVLEDDDFTSITNISTEISTRIKINSETGTAEKSMLFQEEMLPAETVMYSLLLSSKMYIAKDQKKEILDHFKKSGITEENFVSKFFKSQISEIIQIGGDASLGKGIMAIRINTVEKVTKEVGL